MVKKTINTVTLLYVTTYEIVHDHYILYRCYYNDFVNGDQQPNIDNVEITVFCLGVTSHFLKTMQRQSTVTSKYG